MNPTFEILAIGNGEFMNAVMIAVAMLWSSGVFAALGALGALIGLLMLGPQTIASGGQKFDLGSVFVGVLIWVVFFSTSSTVQITEVGFQRPGSTGAQFYVVDNVPTGVAATGWLVSQVGKRITDLMETAFGTVNPERSVTRTGVGRSLQWLAAVRLAGDVNIGGMDTEFGAMRSNLVQYMRWCSVVAVFVDRRGARMNGSLSPLDEDNGYGWKDPNITVPEWIDPNTLQRVATLDTPTCTAALVQLKAYYENANAAAFIDFADVLAPAMGFHSEGTPAQQAVNVAANMNLTLDQAQKYMLGSMVPALWIRALPGSPLLTAQEVNNQIMMHQAIEQKASQMAGEESMFRRMMYPLMTFLEAAFYITAPFMALVLGFGRVGLGIAAKFMMIPLWITLWLPTMAVINLFQIVSFNSQMDLLTGSMNSTMPTYQLGSVAASAHIRMLALDWLATGATLAASAPMISLMFLTGSVYTATALAGTFKGSDVINEKIPSPDLASSSPAISHGALRNYTVGSGQTTTGASQPTLSFARGLSENESRASSELERASRTYSDVSDKTVTDQMMAARSAGVRGDAQSQQRVEAAESRSRGIAQRAGLDSRNLDSQSWRNAVNQALEWSVGAGATLGYNPKGSPYSAEIGTALRYSLSNQLQTSTGMESGLADGFSAAFIDNEEFRASATASHAESISEFASIQGVDSATVAGAQRMSAAAMDMSQRMEQWTSTRSATAQQGASQSFDAGQVGTAFMAAGGEAALAFFNDALASGVSYEKYDNIAQGLNMEGLAIPGAVTAGGSQLTTKDLAAMALAADEQAPGVLASHASSSGVLSILGMSDPSRPERGNLADGVNFGGARDQVQGAGNLGPSAGTEARANAGRALWTQQGRAAAMGTLIAETGLGASAQAAGRYAQEFMNPDGSLNEEKYQQHSEALVATAQGILDAANENERQQAQAVFNERFEGTYLANGFMGQAHADDKGGARLGGLAAMAKGNHVDNTRGGAYEAAIREGSMFNGHRIGGGAAKVLAYYAATVGHGGQELSERQVADMQKTLASLTPAEQYAVRLQIGEWHSDSPRPSSLVPLLPQVARDTRKLGNLGAAPAAVPENSQRASPMMVDTRSGAMNEMPRLQYRTEEEARLAAKRNTREGIR